MGRKSWLVIGSLLVLILAATGAFLLLRENPSPSIPAAKPADATGQKPASQPFAHIFVIVEENQPYANVVGNSSAPYINSLIARYTLAANYFAVAHPSLPNYIALTSGSTQGFTTDCNPPAAGCEVNASNIGDLLAAAGKSWKEYAESMPAACYLLNSGNYATKHNPFVYYKDIVDNRARCQSHVVPFTQLAIDLRSAKTTPDFAFITPNLCNDMHDCGLASGDHWLAREVPPILGSAAFRTQNSLLMITWDEDDGGGNHVATILIGPQVKAGYKLTATYSHYSLLRTIEANWQLPPLGSNDAKVAPLSGFTK